MKYLQDKIDFLCEDEDEEQEEDIDINPEVRGFEK